MGAHDVRRQRDQARRVTEAPEAGPRRVLDLGADAEAMRDFLPGHRVDQGIAVQVAALRSVRRVAHGDVRLVDIELREAEADEVDGFFRDKPETVVALPTGQAFVRKN